MTEYGGLGGLRDGRTVNKDDAFEVAVEESLGSLIRDDMTMGASVGSELWSALANQDWAHENGDTASYSFRAAGDLIAAIRGNGNYMDWYCSGPYATVSDRVRQALEGKGWHPVEG